jgi:hypothetical protein
VEVDFSAAHLTILHGLLGLPFAPSVTSYDIPGCDREEVKRWIMMALGVSNPAIGGPRYAKVRREGVKRFPALANLAAHGISTHDLQFHEAEIMMMAMEDLQSQDVGFLPVHDALAVPRSKRAVAVAALEGAFERYFVQTLNFPAPPAPRIH